MTRDVENGPHLVVDKHRHVLSRLQIHETAQSDGCTRWMLQRLPYGQGGCKDCLYKKCFSLLPIDKSGGVRSSDQKLMYLWTHHEAILSFDLYVHSDSRSPCMYITYQVSDITYMMLYTWRGVSCCILDQEVMYCVYIILHIFDKIMLCCLGFFSEIHAFVCKSIAIINNLEKLLTILYIGCYTLVNIAL